MELVDKVDRWQQRHRVPAFVVGVVKKYGDDRGSQLAAVYTPGFEGPGVALFHDDELVAHAVLVVPAPMVFQHGGTVLVLGRDRGLPVCRDYEPPFPWTGTLHEVVIETGPAIEPSLAERMRGLLHSE